MHALSCMLINHNYFFKDVVPRHTSAVARAKLILDGNNVSFDPKLHCFTVKGTSGLPRIVTLFPKETCSCPSTGSCYHLLAVKMSVGLPLQPKPSKNSLSQLRKSFTKSKKERSGRKRPRINDIDAISQSKLLFTMIRQ